MISTDLRQRLLKFRAERDWEQFHNLRTLSASICLESAELLELTQWVSDSEIDRVVSERRAGIEEEVADLAILMTYLINDLGIDLEACVSRKLQINATKYPIDKARGTSLKYTDLE
jgi:dCTP diphosphatase